MRCVIMQKYPQEDVCASLTSHRCQEIGGSRSTFCLERLRSYTLAHHGDRRWISFPCLRCGNPTNALSADANNSAFLDNNIHRVRSSSKTKRSSPTNYGRVPYHRLVQATYRYFHFREIAKQIVSSHHSVSLCEASIRIAKMIQPASRLALWCEEML